jgi:hypothetical protein
MGLSAWAAQEVGPLLQRAEQQLGAVEILHRELPRILVTSSTDSAYHTGLYTTYMRRSASLFTVE